MRCCQSFVADIVDALLLFIGCSYYSYECFVLLDVLESELFQRSAKMLQKLDDQSFDCCDDSNDYDKNIST